MRKNKTQIKPVKNNELTIKPYSGRVIKTGINPLREKYVKHPKLRKFFDEVDVFMNWSNIISMVLAFIALLIMLGLIYYSLPDNVKGTITSIIGGFMSLIVVPLLLDWVNKKRELRIEQYNQSSDFYEELTKSIIQALTTEEREQIISLIKLIDENYALVGMRLPRKLQDSIMLLYEECALLLSNDKRVTSNYEMLQYFGTKCINIIRKQGDSENNFVFNPMMINEKDDDVNESGIKEENS